MLSGIILAAGESSRMDGRVKQLLRIGKSNFIETIIFKLKALKLSEIVVVLGANSDLIVQNTDFADCTAIINPNWRDGQLSTLKCAVEKLSSSSEGFLLNPCDCPLVKIETYKSIIERWLNDKEKIVIPAFKGKKGHPSIFPSRFYGNILNDELPEGARTLIEKNQKDVCLLEVDDENVTTDIDTYTDYEKAVEQ